jgi:hypothetical protein
MAVHDRNTVRPDIELRFDRFRPSSRLAIGRPGQADRDP